MSQLQPAFLPEPRIERKRSRAPRRPRSATHTHRRRASTRAEAGAQDRLRDFWNEHAIKSGLVVFYAWFMAANWGAVQSLAAGAVARIAG